jgi:hypothetical protein
MRGADSLALNSIGNAKATDRLLSRNGTQFRNRPPVFYVPDLNHAKNVIALPIAGASIHLLGPSRDPKQLALMDPPTSAQWLQLDPHQSADGDTLLSAAAVLERSVNNASVYFVLDVSGTRLLFVGDAQEGAWMHVPNDPAAKGPTRCCPGDW